MNITSKAINVVNVKEKEGGMYYGYCGPGKRHQRRLALLRRLSDAKWAYVQAVKAKMQPAMVVYMNSHVSIPGFGDAQLGQPTAKKVRKPKVKAAPVVDVIVKGTQKEAKKFSKEHIEPRQPAKPRSRAKKAPADTAAA